MARIVAASLLAAGAVFGDAATSCDTSVTLTNVYGQNGQFRLFVNDPTKDPPDATVIFQDFTVPASNGIQTVSLNTDQNGKPVNLIPGVQYSLKLETYGPGVCCGAFSNYTLALSGDLKFSDGTHTHSGFLAPGNFAGDTLQFSVDNSGSSCPVLFDPVPALLTNTVLNSALSFVQNPQLLATQGRLVNAVSADGVTRVIVRIPANTAGQVFSVEVLADPQNSSIDVAQNGGLAAVGQATSGTQFFTVLTNVVAQNVLINGVTTPVAFAVYQAPLDFARPSDNFGNPNPDDNAAKRTVYLSISSGGAQYLHALTIVRPPLLFVHGLTSAPQFWENFTPLIDNDAQFVIRRANYSYRVAGITATDPTYTIPGTSLPIPWPVDESVLGFDYNAPNVFGDINTLLSDFRRGGSFGTWLPAAGVQVDVVAHSMGGVITRSLPFVLPEFYSLSNYLHGTVHKLVTIGTPHLGSPLALDILQPNPESRCLATLQALAGYYPLSTATINGVTYNGAHHDLQGTGQNDASLSPALKRLQGVAYKPFPVAFLAGQYADSQASSLGSYNLNLMGLQAAVMCHTDFTPFQSVLLQDYSFSGWDVFMGGRGDGIVPFNSALNGGPPRPGNVFTAVHGPGTYPVGFSGPNLLDGSVGTAARVLQLLNERVSNADFDLLP